MTRVQSDDVRISVVIATYNRASLLDDCLHHLLAQPWRAGDEIVVADNGSSDATRDVLARYRDLMPDRLQTVVEATPGKSAALQRALRCVTGHVVALTDDDVRVRPDWIEAIRTTFADPAVVLAGGPVHPRWERPAPPWLQIGPGPYSRLAAPVALLHYGAGTLDLGQRTLLGANMAIRREALAELGGFANHLGKLRDTLLSGEDADLCERVRRRGWRAIYTTAVAVEHRVPADRMRLAYYLSWFYWSGITHAAMDDVTTTVGRTLLGLPRWLTRRLLSGCAGVVRSIVGRDTVRLVDAAVDVAFVCGYAVRHWRLTPAARPVPHTAGKAFS